MQELPDSPTWISVINDRIWCAVGQIMFICNMSGYVSKSFCMKSQKEDIISFCNVNEQLQVVAAISQRHRYAIKIEGKNVRTIALGNHQHKADFGALCASKNNLYILTNGEYTATERRYNQNTKTDDDVLVKKYEAIVVECFKIKTSDLENTFRNIYCVTTNIPEDLCKQFNKTLTCACASDFLFICLGQNVYRMSDAGHVIERIPVRNLATWSSAVYPRLSSTDKSDELVLTYATRPEITVYNRSTRVWRRITLLNSDRTAFTGQLLCVVYNQQQQQLIICWRRNSTRSEYFLSITEAMNKSEQLKPGCPIS